MIDLVQVLCNRHDSFCDGYHSKKDPDNGPLSMMEASLNIREIENKAKKGDRESQYDLGILAGWGRYINSKGEQCYCLSREWHKKSAAQLCKESLYELGRLYELGMCVQKSILDAKALYERAAKYGHIDAKNRLERLKSLELNEYKDVLNEQ